MKIKVGFGFDVHQLKDGLDFWLGGIKVPHTKGGLGHSCLLYTSPSPRD